RFDAAAHGPAVARIAIADRCRHTRCGRGRLGFEPRIGVAAGDVDHPGIGGHTQAGAHGPEPRHLPGEARTEPERSAESRRARCVERTFDARGLEISLDAEYGQTGLPVVADLTAADRTLEAVGRRGERRAAQHAKVRFGLRPTAAHVHAEIEPGPRRQRWW